MLGGELEASIEHHTVTKRIFDVQVYYFVPLFFQCGCGCSEGASACWGRWNDPWDGF